MEHVISKFDVAINQLDKITMQFRRGIIDKSDFDAQRLIILIDLANKAIEFESDKGNQNGNM